MVASRVRRLARCVGRRGVDAVVAGGAEVGA